MIYNPYQQQFNPYMQNQNNIYDHIINRQEIVKVNGEGGAKAYQMPPNSSILLLDETEPVIWCKTTDGAGYPNLTAYTITPRQQEKPADFKTLEERITRLEGLINNESNTVNVAEFRSGESFKQNLSDQKYDERKS